MVSYKQFSDIKIPYTWKKEQQKIVSFLFIVDEKIEKIKEKKELWEEYKKGVMQRIFSVGNKYFCSDKWNKNQNKGNKNIRSLRFKDENGEEFGEWEEKRLRGICKKQSSQFAESEFEKYRLIQDKLFQSDFDRVMTEVLKNKKSNR